MLFKQAVGKWFYFLETVNLTTFYQTKNKVFHELKYCIRKLCGFWLLTSDGCSFSDTPHVIIHQAVNVALRSNIQCESVRSISGHKDFNLNSRTSKTVRAKGCPRWCWSDSKTLRLSPFRSTLDIRCSLESTQYRRLLDKSEKMQWRRGRERKKKTKGERERGGERKRGHWKRKGPGWEVYECNGPVATPSIFFDTTAEALHWENTDVIVILPLDFFAGGNICALEQIH